MDNLIDLSIEDDTHDNAINAEKSQRNSETIAGGNLLAFISTETKERVSLDSNNPFDRAQKIANNNNDPFERVSNEAYFGTTLCDHMMNVQMAKLLPLDDEDQGICSHSIDEESPPITMSSSVTSGIEESDFGNAGNNLCAKGKAMGIELRKALLRRSLTNSVLCNSTACHSSCNNKCQSTANSSIVLTDDDLSAETPPNFSDSVKDFEADLEMLKIPMLKEATKEKNENEEEIMTDTCDTQNREEKHDFSAGDEMSTDDAKTDVAISNINQLRLKLQKKRRNSCNGAVKNEHDSDNNISNNNIFGSVAEDIPKLIQSLKSLICTDMADDAKKLEASSLLENLSSACGGSVVKNPTPPPIKPSIIRQDTFDLELDEQREHNVPIDNLPEAMLSSTATYDGEARDEEEQNFQLPEVDPNYINSCQPPPSTIIPTTDVNDLIGQLNKILEQHHLGNQSVANSSDCQTDGGTATQGNANTVPTFIVVMPPNTPKTLPYSKANISPPKCHEELNSTAIRRRSQSLSLHDKLKIVQLPIPTPTKKQHLPQLEIPEKEFVTPIRTAPRRNSISCTPNSSNVYGTVRRTQLQPSDATTIRPIRPLTSHTRRSITGEPYLDGRQQAAIVRPMTFSQTNMPTVKPTDLRTRSKQDSILRSVGPLKATIPIKTVVPMKPPQNVSTVQRGISKNRPTYSSTTSNSTLPPKTRPNSTSNPTRSRYSMGSVAPPGIASPRPYMDMATNSSSTNKNRYDYKIKSPLKLPSNYNKCGASATSGSLLVRRKSITETPRTAVNRASTITTTPGLAKRSLPPCSNSSTTIISRNKENKLP